MCELGGKGGRMNWEHYSCVVPVMYCAQCLQNLIGYADERADIHSPLPIPVKTNWGCPVREHRRCLV
eukprot:8953442-Heterocapsa_arctica.AAC.1